MPDRTKHEVVRGRGHPSLAALILAAAAGLGAAHEVGAQATDAGGHVAANGHYLYVRAQVPDPGLAPGRGGAHSCAAGDGQALARFRRGLPRHHQHVGRVEARRHGPDDQFGGG